VELPLAPSPILCQAATQGLFICSSENPGFSLSHHIQWHAKVSPKENCVFSQAGF